MRAPRLAVFGAASHICSCAQSSSSSNGIIGPNSAPCNRSSRDGYSTYSPLLLPKETQQQQGREAARYSWFVTGGGGASSAVAAEDECHSRWWRSRKRWAKRHQAQLAAKEAAEGRLSLAQQLARKQVIAVQGMLRRLRRWLGAIVDITTLKRIRLLRKARKVRRRNFKVA